MSLFVWPDDLNDCVGWSCGILKVIKSPPGQLWQGHLAASKVSMMLANQSGLCFLEAGQRQEGCKCLFHIKASEHTVGRMNKSTVEGERDAVTCFRSMCTSTSRLSLLVTFFLLSSLRNAPAKAQQQQQLRRDVCRVTAGAEVTCDLDIFSV